MLLAGLEIDRYFEPGRLLHRKVGWLCALENIVDITRNLAAPLREARAERCQPSPVNVGFLNSERRSRLDLDSLAFDIAQVTESLALSRLCSGWNFSRRF